MSYVFQLTHDFPQIKTTFGGGDTNTDKPFGDRRQTNYQQQQQQQQQQQPRRPLDQVTCFKVRFNYDMPSLGECFIGDINKEELIKSPHC